MFSTFNAHLRNLLPIFCCCHWRSLLPHILLMKHIELIYQNKWINKQSISIYRNQKEKPQISDLLAASKLTKYSFWTNYIRSNSANLKIESSIKDVIFHDIINSGYPLWNREIRGTNFSTLMVFWVTLKVFLLFKNYNSQLIQVVYKHTPLIDYVLPLLPMLMLHKYLWIHLFQFSIWVHSRGRIRR